MNTERDLDRLTRAWLDLMPDEAPDRAIAAVLQAVERTPQARRPFGVPLLRMPPMSRRSTGFVAALVAIAAVVALIAILPLLNPGQTQGVAGRSSAHRPSPQTESSAAAVADPSANALSDAVPAALQHVWVGRPSVDSGTGIQTDRLLTFDATSVALTGTNFPDSAARSTVGTSGAAMTLTTIAAAPPSLCAAGQTGAYTWTLSPGGTLLTIAAGQDPCAGRAALAVGTWYRMACANPADNCLGLVEAGTFATQWFDPRATGTGWTPRWGAVSYTVPAGWANSGDFPFNFSLTPAATYTQQPHSGALPGKWHELDLRAQAWAATQDTACSGSPDPKVARTATAVGAFLRSLPGVVASPPSTVTVDGHPAITMSLSLAQTWIKACPGDKASGLVLFAKPPSLTPAAWSGPAGNRGATADLIAGEQLMLTLVDLGQGNLVAIVVDSGDGTAFDTLVTDTRPIIESLAFK